MFINVTRNKSGNYYSIVDYRVNAVTGVRKKKTILNIGNEAKLDDLMRRLRTAKRKAKTKEGSSL
jgi:hypothetical protein